MSPRTALAAAVLAGSLGLAPFAALAASPISGAVQLQMGDYRPNVDAATTTNPYQQAFGATGRPYGFKLDVARDLPWRQAGTLEVGLGAGFWQVKGHSVDKDGNPTADATALKIIPTRLSFTYRLDQVWTRLGVPLVPYARASLERYNWWITGAGGSTSKTGATNGYSYGGGLGLVLDYFDSTLSREFDADVGVNCTMLTFEVTQAKVDDFGAKNSAGTPKSWDLSDTRPTYSLGLLFVF